MKPPQVATAGAILAEIVRDWRELVAGSEGFLTSTSRRGLYRHQVVWGDMDSMGHVNNTIYNRYAESGRIGWAQKLAALDPAHRREWSELCGPRSVGFILRAITTEFKFPMQWPDHVSVYHKLRARPTAGTESFVLDVLIMSERQQRPAARCVEDIVVYDYRVGRKTALEPFMIAMLQDTWRLQEDTRRVYGARVVGLLERVRLLELETWDREGAVEDMGDAGP